MILSYTPNWSVIYDHKTFIVQATVITIVNYDHTVITIINYNNKTFIVQATGHNVIKNLEPQFTNFCNKLDSLTFATNIRLC